MLTKNDLMSLSPIAISNLYTMGCASEVDLRQEVPAPYTMPVVAVRILRARLCVEEVLVELCDALGVVVKPDATSGKYNKLDMENISFEPSGEPDMEKAIDACIDGIYVLVGTLCAMGVADGPHCQEVSMANNAKFPKGKALIDEHGKYQKPEGWHPPFHADVRKLLECDGRLVNLAELSRKLVQDMREVKPAVAE